MKIQKSHLCTVATVIALISFMAVHKKAVALDIILNYDSAQSIPPSYDLNGDALTALFEHAESTYEDIFEESHTLTVNYWWDDLGLGTAGKTDQVANDGSRFTEVNLRIDSIDDDTLLDFPWFVDPTPALNEEFDVQQTLWRDLDPIQQSDWFNVTTVPDTLEIGFKGNALVGSDADGKGDLLTTILHEIGHAVGQNAQFGSGGAGGDFDFDPNFIFGHTAAVKVDPSASDNGHIAPDGVSLMCGDCGTDSIRRLLSHTDIFSMGTAAGYTQIDAPRREYYGGANWNAPGNWSGNQVPGAFDDAYVRMSASPSTNTTTLSGLATAANLFISEQATVNAANQILEVQETLLVEDSGTSVQVGNSGTIQATDLIARNNGEVRTFAGSLVDVDRVELDGGNLVGAGSIEIRNQLLNNGTLAATGGTLTLTKSLGGPAGGIFDLDGESPSDSSEQGIVNVLNGSLVVDGELADAFNGTLNIGASNTATFNNAWTLEEYNATSAATGTLTLANDGALNGNLVSVRGIVNAVVGGGFINADANFESTAVVNVSSILRLSGQTTVSAGTTFAGAGSIENLGSIQLADGADIGPVDLYNSGTLTLGDSPGQASTGAFVNTTDGTLEIEIGGTIAGDDFDNLLVAGAATLDGTLDVSLIDGFVPTLGNTFNIVTAAGGMGGMFSSEIVPDLGPHMEMNVAYTSNSVILAVAPTLLGDINIDGFVDAADAGIMFGNWGPTTLGYFDGNLNGDEYIDAADAGIMFANWTGDVGPATTTIPEPSTLLLASLAGCVMLQRRQRA